MVVSNTFDNNFDTVFRLIPETETSLNPSSGLHTWDQFETNERLYNVTSTYDENIYTKKLDKSTLTKEQQRQAERLAREIESQVSDNIHLREERGHALERDVDEEDLYSGVRRDKEDVWARGKTVAPGKHQQRDSRSKSTERSPGPLAAPPGLPQPEKRDMIEESKTEVASEVAQQSSVTSEPIKEKPDSQAESADEVPKSEISPVESKPSGLNPSAKSFVLNAKAAEFTPKNFNADSSKTEPPNMPPQRIPPEFMGQQFIPYAAPFPMMPPMTAPMQTYEYQSFGQHPQLMYAGVPQFEVYPGMSPMSYGGYPTNFPIGYQPHAPNHQGMPMRQRHQSNKGYQSRYVLYLRWCFTHKNFQVGGETERGVTRDRISKEPMGRLQRRVVTLRMKVPI